MVGVVDHQGHVRGYIPADYMATKFVDGKSDLPNGVLAAAVHTPDGELVGFYVNDLGFVELDVAQNAKRLAQLADCMTAAQDRVPMSSACDDVISAGGFDPLWFHQLDESAKPKPPTPSTLMP
jgi:hypothetical protein